MWRPRKETHGKKMEEIIRDQREKIRNGRGRAMSSKGQCSLVVTWGLPVLQQVLPTPFDSVDERFRRPSGTKACLNIQCMYLGLAQRMAVSWS
jgi:hypothetical protein